jgi:hypothetical protein
MRGGDSVATVRRSVPGRCGVLISARSYEEYVAMFDLGPTDVRGSVLDCNEFQRGADTMLVLTPSSSTAPTAAV